MKTESRNMPLQNRTFALLPSRMMCRGMRMARGSTTRDTKYAWEATKECLKFLISPEGKRNTTIGVHRKTEADIYSFSCWKVKYFSGDDVWWLNRIVSEIYLLFTAEPLYNGSLNTSKLLKGAGVRNFRSGLLNTVEGRRASSFQRSR